MRIEYSRVEYIDVRTFLDWSTPEDVINSYQEHISNSTAIWVGKLDGIDVAAAGLISTSLFADQAYVWMLGTNISKRNGVLLILWSQLVLKEMHALYPHIVGWCHIDNAAAQKWMKWLGADFNIGGKYPNHISFRISRP